VKKALYIIIALCILSGCGVGSKSISSGKADECFISFTTKQKKAPVLSVDIDGKVYELSAVYEKAYKKDRDIKKTSENTLRLVPGTHKVTVTSEGEVIYSKTLVISVQEHRVVEL